MTPKEKLTPQELYQAIHHELVASASVTRLARLINPAFKIGCMILAMPAYPMTSDPRDILAAKQFEQRNLLFSDIQVRGKYPSYAKSFLRSSTLTFNLNRATVSFWRSIRLTFYPLAIT